MPIKRNRAEVEHFHDFLRRKGLKKTYQKDLILETFLNAEGHLSVEDVYAQVKKKDKKVGVVTVFRTLKSLSSKDCGIAREISLGDGLTRFEHCFQHPYHHHIICEKCHKAIEFVSPELERVQEEIIESYGFRASNHRIQTYGICRECMEDRGGTATEKQDTEKVFARDALKMALAMEERCLEFFQNSAAGNRDPEGKKVFERMALEEENHIADLKSKLDALYHQEKDLERAPLFLHYDADELKALVPDLEGIRKDGGLWVDAGTAIALCHELSRKASEFFKKYAEKFADTLGKRIFVNFAVQEEQHCDIMKQRMEGRLQPGIQ